MEVCKVLGANDLDSLSGCAAQSERLRKNYNVHPELSDSIQRLCNAFEPGTYVRPHSHSDEGRWELFVLLRGRGAVLTFDDTGRVLERIDFNQEGGASLVEIPPRAIHAIVSLERGTVFFEVKPGPYRVATDKDFAQWAPEEGAPATVDWVNWYEVAQPGEVFGGEPSRCP